MKMHVLISRNGKFPPNMFVILVIGIRVKIVGVNMGVSVPIASWYRNG
jgi:hypothetical protein